MNLTQGQVAGLTGGALAGGVALGIVFVGLAEWADGAYPEVVVATIVVMVAVLGGHEVIMRAADWLDAPDELGDPT